MGHCISPAPELHSSLPRPTGGTKLIRTVGISSGHKTELLLRGGRSLWFSPSVEKPVVERSECAWTPSAHFLSVAFHAAPAIWTWAQQHGECASSGGMASCCLSCVSYLATHLYHLSQNAYTTTAINGTDLCTSTKDSLKILSRNSNHFTSVNSFGDFVIFLGKVLVVYFTVFGGLMAFNYNRTLQVWAIPLLLVAFFACLVAHCFLSVFETVLDVLFLCFTVDLETNDGSSEKPYFMDHKFLNFVRKINKSNRTGAQTNKDSLRNEEGTELRPIVI